MDDVDDHIPVLQPGSNFPGAPASTNVPLSAKPDFWSGEGDTDPDAELNPEEDPTPVDFLAKELNPWATPNPSQPVGNGMPSMGKGGMFGFLPTNAYFIPVPTPTYAASFKVGGVKVNPGLGMQMPSGNIQTGTGAGTGMYYVGVPQSVTNYNQGVKTLWGAYGHCLYYANIVTSTKNQIAKQQDGLNKAQTQLSKAQGEEQKISALLQQYTKFTPQQIQQGSGEARQLIANEQSLQTKISNLQNECANHQTNISLLQTKEKNAATQGQNFQIKEISQLANVMKLFVELPTQPWSVFSPTPPQ